MGAASRVCFTSIERCRRRSVVERAVVVRSVVPNWWDVESIAQNDR